ncbi:MAG: formate/nitrite transporter family protein [Cyclobacteriaceae bacterium]
MWNRDKNKTKKDQPKTVDEILEEQIAASLHEHKRSNVALLISAFGGGMEVGFSIFLMGTITTLFYSSLSSEALHVILSFCYSVGFIFVIIGRSELFTEHTALAVLPVLNRSVTVGSLFILWGIVYLGNLLGGYVFGIIITELGDKLEIIDHNSFIYLGKKMTGHSWSTILFSGMMAGWLMGLLGWLVTSSQETISRIIVVILVTTTIGFGGLHHCIVGSIEVFASLLTDGGATFNEYLKFQSASTLGNIVGGVVFVALLKFSHIRIN